MQIAQTIDQIRQYVAQARTEGKTVGLVPTMGALHVGHISLIEAAAERCDDIVVSIFINPTQFGPGEDFDAYPRPLEADIEICRAYGVGAVFAPTATEMYPRQMLTWVTVEELTGPLCGRSRPGHFRGVTTVCAKLFNIVRPDAAFFGQKDAQQTIVIQRMVADLNMPLEIVVCPTVREPDGLAVSSRNRYLDPEQRKDASIIYQALEKARAVVEVGVRNAEEIRAEMQATLSRAPALEVEYIAIVDAESLEALDVVAGRVLVAVAARLGATRLIDNIRLDIS